MQCRTRVLSTSMHVPPLLAIALLFPAHFRFLFSSLSFPLSLSLSLFRLSCSLCLSNTLSHPLFLSWSLLLSRAHQHTYVCETYLTCMGEPRLRDIRELHLCKNAPAVNAPSVHVFERRDSQRYVNHDSCAAAGVSTSIYPRVDTTRRTRTHWHTHIFCRFWQTWRQMASKPTKLPTQH